MKISIELENNNQLSYFAGSTIIGSVLLNINNPNGIKSSGLKIKCTGEAKVRWTIRHGKQTSYRSDHEIYFICQTYLIGSRDGPEIPILPGLQRFPFVFVLPRNIPSSFIGEHGRIEYYLQASLKRSWKFDAKTRLNFSVNGIVDLNTIRPPLPNVQSMQTPVILTNEDNAQLFCWNSRPIRFELIVNQLGFVPGQPILFELNVSNLSNTRIRSCSVSMYQGVSYTAQNKHFKFHKKLLSKVRLGEVGSGEDKSWKDCRYTLPSLPPSGLGGCQLIDIKYWMEVHVSSFILSAKGEVPFIIGNIPLVPGPVHVSMPIPSLLRPELPPITGARTNTTNYTSNSHNSNYQQTLSSEFANVIQRSTSTTTTTTTTGSILDDYPNLTLPSYEDVVGACPTYEEAAAINEEQTVYMQNKNFRPKYAVYHTTIV